MARFSPEHRRLAQVMLDDYREAHPDGGDEIAYLAERLKYSRTRAEQLVRAVRHTRPHSYEFRAKASPHAYLLKGIPPTLWGKLVVQAKREHVSMRILILRLLEGWLEDADARKEQAS